MAVLREPVAWQNLQPKEAPEEVQEAVLGMGRWYGMQETMDRKVKEKTWGIECRWNRHVKVWQLLCAREGGVAVCAA